MASRIALALFSIPLVCRMHPASAVDSDALAEPVTLPTVVVTPTRLPTPESEIGSSITVIPSEEIERKQERTLPDALQYVPGLNVVQTGGPGGTTSVFIRGANANQTKVFIDGIDATDPATGTFNFEHILTWDVDLVEIVRGPQSGLYGDDAIGGVVNIITKQGSGPAQFGGSIEGGSFGTFNQNGSVKGSLDRFNYYLDVAHFHSSDTPVTPNDLVPVGRSVQGDAYDNKTLSSRFGINLADNFDIGLVARYFDTSLLFTGDDILGPESLKSTEQDQQLFTRGTAHLVSFDGVFDQTVGLSYTRFNQLDFDPTPPNAEPSYFNGHRLKADWQGNLNLMPGQVLTLRAEHQRDQITTPAAEITDNAGMIQLQSSFGERFFNAVSLRYDSYGTFGGKATFRIAPDLLIPETDTKLKGSIGTGFKPPTLAELFQNFPSFGFFGNPNLKPETSIGYDLGFEQAVLEKHLQFGATYFHNNIDNLIEANDTGTSYQNVGRATTYGVESFVTYTPWEPLTLHGDYTFLIAKDDILNEELLRRPKNKASLDAAWHITEAAVLSATLLYVGPWVDVDRAGTVSGLPANGYTLVNLAGSYDLGYGLTAYARINNLLDRRYQDPIGFQRPGFGIFAGVRLAFDTASQSGKPEREVK
ncbi:MAG: TonB-dependent receptor [Acetobacteraceae bacterium]|nr:TonB-dependent receptor [Acetobacteraceae bacterium]